MKNKKRKNIVSGAGVLLIAVLIGVNASFMFTPITAKAETMNQTEPIGNRTTETFYGTSSCGFLWRTGDDYSTIWNMGDGLIGDPNIGIGQMGAIVFFWIYRGFVYFDTSSLPDSVTITSATLSLYGHSDYSEYDFSIVVQNGQPTYPHDPMTAGDYYRGCYSGNGGSLNTNYFSINSYNDIALNNYGIGWINKQGTTKLCLRSNNEIDGDEPYNNQELVIVYGSSGRESRPKLTVEYINQAPNKPQQPYGPTSGKPGVEYTYITSTTDPEGDQVFYQWRWGDGTQSEWFGPYNSGAEASATKSWPEGTYSITVKAKDTGGSESDWSTPLSVIIPRGKQHTNIFLTQILECFPNVFPILRHLLG